MNISFHTGKTAMIAQARALNVYGNNIANINTVGYQTLRPDFADCIYETERAPEGDWQTGHGTYIQKTDLMFSESFFVETERPQDMAIAGEGWFAVQDRNGNVNYTRDGKFGITQLDGTWYLVSSQGEYVLDYDRNRIEVPFESVGKQTIIGETNWQDIANRIGTFSVTGNGAETIRYTYSGTSNAVNPPRVENPQLTATPSALDPLTAATLSAPAGYFAVRANANSVPVYTRDTQLSIQTYNGRYVLGSTNGDILLDDKFRAISMIFKPSSGDVSMDHINMVMTRQTGEGENAVKEYAFRNAENGLTEYKAIADLTTIGAVRDAESGKFYLATAEGEYLLNSGGNRIEVKITEGDYFMVDWDATIANVGVFAVPENELSTTDSKRYNGTATASNVEKLLAYDAPGGITLGDKDGFYALQGANGEIRYARNAKLDIMQGEDGAWYLSTVQGEYVLDGANNRIVVAQPTDTHNVDWAGVRDAVGVFVFPNPYGLEAMGSNRYRETARSGEAEADRNMEKLQNALVTSNVELSDMMVKLIETQRSYQLSSRVVTTSDELAQISNNLR
ncbi:MAG: flagellar hook-basal body complex protein [Oscillospiraceae bacterium]|nr:flagellar hook-basal body complex protein [Oscillospiraceae bacterium]